MSLSDTHQSAPDPASSSTNDAEHQALREALSGLLESLARLAVARGLPYATVEDWLKRAFVHAADQAHPGLPAHRKVSRISTTTGINRREVTRLTQDRLQVAPTRRSLASEVFSHWRTQPPYRARNGQPKVLPRHGPAPSFESLAQTVTRDVHPRSLLDELGRLGLAHWDRESDSVSLTRELFVPHGDPRRKLAFLGDNVGDHLRAAVDNVLGAERTHFEQAVFADGLSVDSLESVRPLVRAQWQDLLAALVPALQERVAKDAALRPPPQGRLRVGLYSWQEPQASAAPNAVNGAQSVDNPAPPAQPAPSPPGPETPLRRTVTRRKNNAK
jgi:hypothetical protein